MALTAQQYERLRGNLAGARVATRSQGGKQLSYLESWDVRAHLIRIFGYGNFDAEMLDYHHVDTREYLNNSNEMVEVLYAARMRLTIRVPGPGWSEQLCTYVEAAVGSASGRATMLGETHDNALKTAASDALKRCAINLGTQFGLSLYDDGRTTDVIRDTVIKPEGWQSPEPTDEQAQRLATSVGTPQSPSSAAKQQAGGPQ